MMSRIQTWSSRFFAFRYVLEQTTSLTQLPRFEYTPINSHLHSSYSQPPHPQLPYPLNTLGVALHTLPVRHHAIVKYPETIVTVPARRCSTELINENCATFLKVMATLQPKHPSSPQTSTLSSLGVVISLRQISVMTRLCCYLSSAFRCWVDINTNAELLQEWLKSSLLGLYVARIDFSAFSSGKNVPYSSGKYLCQVNSGKVCCLFFLYYYSWTTISGSWHVESLLTFSTVWSRLTCCK